MIWAFLLVVALCSVVWAFCFMLLRSSSIKNCMPINILHEPDGNKKSIHEVYSRLKKAGIKTKFDYEARNDNT